MSPIILGSVNPILQNPDVALPILGGLLAAGGGLKLHQILSAADVELDGEAALEADLLEDSAPKGFWHRAVLQVTKSVQRGPSNLRWHRGIWNVNGPVAQSTVILTPMLEDGELVPSKQAIANHLQAQSGVWLGSNS